MVTELGSFSAGQILTATDLNDIATWTDYTPSFAGGVTVGNGTWAAGYAIVNKILFFQGKFTLGSTSAITGNVTLTVPDSRTLFNNTEIVGNVRMTVGSGSDVFLGTITENGSTAVRVNVSDSSSTYLGSSQITATIPATWQSNNTMSITYWLRID